MSNLFRQWLLTGLVSTSVLAIGACHDAPPGGGDGIDEPDEPDEPDTQDQARLPALLRAAPIERLASARARAPPATASAALGGLFG
ncbi:MAG: hypothetical protein H7138_11975, partial [Myxococcales bacterium]|nr:hypothetical protein [Myxococcales bacterium]